MLTRSDIRKTEIKSLNLNNSHYIEKSLNSSKSNFENNCVVANTETLSTTSITATNDPQQLENSESSEIILNNHINTK